MATRYAAPIVTAQTGQVVSVEELKRTGRIGRRPSHRFNVAFRPWQIQPIMIAPVLPGETLTNLLMQARVQSDPIKSNIVGWWSETYFFYVKLRDLAARDDLTNMLVTGASIEALRTAAKAKTSHNGFGLDFTSMCLESVVEEYFRDEDTTALQFAVDDLPLMQMGIRDYTDSLQLDSAVPDTGEELPGENPSLPSHMAAFSDHFAQWEAMRSMELTEATFEDWLKAFGVSAPREVKEEIHKPELIRYLRDFQMPSNTVDPSTGLASGAVSWQIAERADKKRFIQEPGFLFGVTVARPKVYVAANKAAASHFLDDPYAWLPAVLQSEPYTSLKKFPAAGGPQSGVHAEDYWIDIRDLFIHGDTFLNYAPVAGTNNVVNGQAVKYPAAGDLDALFVDVNRNKIRMDGRCDLNILGRLTDTSL